MLIYPRNVINRIRTSFFLLLRYENGPVTMSSSSCHHNPKDISCTVGIKLVTSSSQIACLGYFLTLGKHLLFTMLIKKKNGKSKNINELIKRKQKDLK